MKKDDFIFCHEGTKARSNTKKKCLVNLRALVSSWLNDIRVLFQEITSKSRYGRAGCIETTAHTDFGGA